MFDTILLRSLLAVADTGGFTRAAERLHLTQSAISAHIRRLESEVGHKLLERTTRSVSLTVAGARLAGYARTILALHDDARTSLGAGGGSSKSVSVGASEEMTKSEVIECLHRFSATHGDVDVTLKIGLAGELLGQLRAGELDIVLGSRCGRDERGEVLWSEPLVWAAKPGCAPAEQSLDTISLVVYPDSCPYRAAAIEALVRAGWTWRIACQSPSAEGLMMAVAGGLGIAPIPRSAAAAAGFVELAMLPALPDAQFLLAAAAKLTPMADMLLSELRRSAARPSI